MRGLKAISGEVLIDMGLGVCSPWQSIYALARCAIAYEMGVVNRYALTTPWVVSVDGWPTMVAHAEVRGLDLGAQKLYEMSRLRMRGQGRAVDPDPAPSVQ